MRTWAMSEVARDRLYRRHRYPAEIIAPAVWLYFRFPLSLRMVEDMLASRGIIVTHQTVRSWAEKFGRHFAREIKRRSAGCLGDIWHLDECVVAINGKKQWLWRAVDQDGFVLEVLVQSRRNAKAAKRLMRKLLKAQGRTPRVMITDKLRSYDAARRDLMPGVEHRSHKKPSIQQQQQPVDVLQSCQVRAALVDDDLFGPAIGLNRAGEESAEPAQ
ncbi:hypothetical protein GCM10007919_51390 [Rhizobium indigoferae]|nr:hypothetical protein GCM10007919_51390 [Rhizobium indigoferae]